MEEARWNEEKGEVRRVRLIPQVSPPRRYYADNVDTLFSRVTTLYDDVLDENLDVFGRTVLDLTTDAKRLFARLCSRKGDLMRVDSLRYKEVDQLSHAICELEDHGIVSRDVDVDIEAALRLYPKPLLLEILPECSKTLSRNALLDEIRELVSEEELVQRLFSHSPWIKFCVRDQLDVYSFLFFGNMQEDLSTFVVRDLGIRAYEDYAIDEHTRLFGSSKTLEGYLNLWSLSRSYDDEREDLTPEDRLNLAVEVGLESSESVNERLRSRILNRIGRDLERQDARLEAITVYRQSTLCPARERTVRCFKKIYEDQEATRCLNEIKEKPWSMEEREFAVSFGTRFKEDTFCRVDSRKLEMTAQFESVESHAITELQKDGVTGWHLENSLPVGLFTLAYWKWIFAPVDGAFVNEFQSAPLDLFWPEFFVKRQELCRSPLHDPSQLPDLIERNAERKRGIACRGLSWEIWTPEFTATLLSVLSAELIYKILLIMKKDLRQMWSGFPDLTVVDQSKHVQFIEVKSPTDRLQLNQRIWIRALQDQEIPVSVLRYR